MVENALGFKKQKQTKQLKENSIIYIIMMESLDIVSLIESNPITKLTNDYNNKLLIKIKQNFTETEQQLFVSSFYCYLNYNSTTDFVIDLDNVWKWLEFKQKVKAKTLLENHFKLNIDYINLLSHAGKQDKSHGGHNKETFMMTIKTFKLFCIKAETSKAKEIHEYFVKLEEILQQTIQEESEELKKQLSKQNEELLIKEKELEENKKMLEETEKITKCNEIPTIYIFNIDTTRENPELKIGVTHNVSKRIKPYKQICKHGKLEFTHTVENTNLKTMEYYIHSLLSFSRVKDEVFQIDVEQAKLIILNVINLFETVSITNNSEKVLKLNQLLEKTKPEIKISTAEIACQTDFDENVPESTPLLFYDNSIKNNFNQFIDEMCIVRNDVEVSSKDIEGLYRLWNKEKPKKETFHAFKHYLDTRFKPCRLEKQDKNHVVYGYKGVSLKAIEYKKKLEQSDAQIFLFQVCKFSPSGTILNSTLLEEYQKWKQSVSKEINANEANEIKDYLKDCDYTMYSTIWSSYGNGQGYYGLYLKSDEYKCKKTSSTGKTVYKIHFETNEILGTWDTIAKAAQYENISSTKMSHAVRLKKIFNNDYFYTTQK
jgi:phage anti-repressor protein